MLESQIASILEWMSQNLSADRIATLKAQSRPDKTCIFVDTDSWTCSIYPVRPEICRSFGLYQNLPCPYAPELALGSRKDFATRVSKDFVSLESLRSVGDNYTWGDVPNTDSH